MQPRGSEGSGRPDCEGHTDCGPRAVGRVLSVSATVCRHWAESASAGARGYPQMQDTPYTAGRLGVRCRTTTVCDGIRTRVRPFGVVTRATMRSTAAAGSGLRDVRRVRNLYGIGLSQRSRRELRRETRTLHGTPRERAAPRGTRPPVPQSWGTGRTRRHSTRPTGQERFGVPPGRCRRISGRPPNPRSGSDPPRIARCEGSKPSRR